jgi:ankyrin repeat protein
VVQYLCEQGADKGAKSTVGLTALHVAAEKGHFPVAQYLFDHRAAAP